MTKHIIPFLLLPFVFVAGCKKKNSNNNTTTTCDKVWTVTKPAVTTSSATIENGYLLMSVTGCKNGDVLNVYRSSLTGDFTAVVNYQDFTPATGAGGFLQFVVSDPAKLDSGFVLCVTSNSLISANVGKGTASIKGTSSVSGKMTITRTGNSLTATTESGTATATVTRNWLATSCNIGFQLGSNINDLSGVLSVKILDITVTQGATTWMSEKFDCNSLK